MMNFKTVATRWALAPCHSLAFQSTAMCLGAMLLTGSANADQVFNDDVIITFSLCVGQDCNNGEVFGFDTIKLKENNTRIKFDDTSSSASFPNFDWQLTANESNNGGLNKFSIEDITSGRTPFTIEGGATNNALYVDDGGRLGLKTSAPVVDIHTVSGNTPTLRLEQNGSSGFTPQSWDVAGNEAGFFVRDVTNGGVLPFRILPGVSGDHFVIAGNGNVGIGAGTSPSGAFQVANAAGAGDDFIVLDNGHVGIGTTTPTAPLHVTRSDETAQIFVEETTNVQSFRTLLHLSNFGDPAMLFTNTANSNEWTIRPGAVLTMQNSNATPPTANLFHLTSAGDLTIPGTITTGGATCGGGCDRVFEVDFKLPSISQHAEMMWKNKHLPEVGPTLEGQPMDLTDKVGRMLNELEKAHIYIEQLHKRNIEAVDRIEDLYAQLELLEGHR